MADEDPDLQRRLDLMFGSARPRQGFEEDLWRRLEARRPWSERIAQFFRPAVRFAPALAALLIIVVGASIFLSGPRVGGGSSTGSSSYSGEGAQVSRPAGAFGQLPAPLGTAEAPLTGAQAAAGVPKSADLAGSSYAFSGQLPTLPPTLPVYRYREPSIASRAALAKTLQDRTGLKLTTSGSRVGTSEEPRFATGQVAGGAVLPTRQATADAFVRSHRLTPGFPFQVSLSSDGISVVYGREFPGPGGQAPQVRRDGSLSGLMVDFQGDVVMAAEGPLDLPLEAADYPLRAAADALATLGIGSPSSATGREIILDSARLVYIAVPSTGLGFYQPMLLLSGSGAHLLAPLVAPEQLKG